MSQQQGVRGPRLELETLLAQMVSQAEEMMSSQSRLRDLIRVNHVVTSDLDLDRGSFSPDDVELAQALAATAGIAIANARQFDESQYRERWSSGLAEAAWLLLGDEDGEHVPHLLETVRRLAEADMVGLCTIDAEALTVRMDETVGDGIALPPGAVLDDPDRRVIDPVVTGEPAIVADLTGTAERDGKPQSYVADVAVVPFATSFRPGSALWVARGPGRLAFRDRDLAMIQSFTNHVGVTQDRADVRRTRRRVAMLEDRSRIARDLHDHVIQRLFATGLSLQATAAQVGPGAAERLSELAQEIDAAITQIRHSIFALNQDVERSGSGLRSRILAVVARIGEHLPRQPTVLFVGPVDLMTDAELAHDVEAVVSEALTNAVRHAQAEMIAVEITIESGTIRVTVTDDGVGLGSSSRRSGLVNLAERAARHGGTSSIRAGDAGGSVLQWQAALDR